MFECSNVQMFECSNVQIFKCSNVQMLKFSNVKSQMSNVNKVKLLSERSSGHFFQKEVNFFKVQYMFYEGYMCFLQTHQVFFLSNLSRLFFAPCVTCDVISAQSNQINVSMMMMMMMARVGGDDDGAP